jgi:hypothetical protein
MALPGAIASTRPKPLGTHPAVPGGVENDDNVRVTTSKTLITRHISYPAFGSLLELDATPLKQSLP